MKIRSIETVLVNACEYTTWTFVAVHTDEGITGWGEATLGGHENAVQAAVSELNLMLAGKDTSSIRCLTSLGPVWTGGLPRAAAISAVEQALWDLAGKAAGLPVYQLLGGAMRERVPVYANLNRGTRDRTPAGYAASARQAVNEGFRAVKCTPFDGVSPGDMSNPDGRARISLGLERAATVRAAIGADILLMVDCHWRFQPEEAVQIAAELAPLNLFWLEDMVDEGDLNAWVRFRGAHGVKMAGGERRVGLAANLRFLTAGVWDYACPDVKYCGGLAELQRIAAVAEAYGVQVAPHNPSGPVSTLASAHVSATLPNLVFLEYAWGECPWRSELVRGAERLVDGFLYVPAGPGLGADPDPEVIKHHPYVPVVPLSQRIGRPII